MPRWWVQMRAVIRKEILQIRADRRMIGLLLVAPFIQGIEVCDDEGNPIGYFVSCLEHDPQLYEWAKSQLSDDELLRRRNARGNGRTTDEVIKRLEAE